MKFLVISIFLFLSLMCCKIVAIINPDEVLAFPGAEGFGKYTTGGRGGAVFVVSTLNDHGPGSLREAIGKKMARTILFSVSGTISLESQLDINQGDLTLAGQSAPGDGICIRNYPVRINADNIIIRYMRFRMGDEKKVQGDAFYGMRHKNIIIDHCSMSWSTDECSSFYDNENFTMQWCIISESLNASVHEKGEHGYGGIWGGMGASFHHNLLANHNSRNPRFCGARYHKKPEREVVDFCNNVIYNWGINSSYAGEQGNHNMINNYYKPGPATPQSKAERILNPWSPFGKFYVQGNVVVGSPKVTADNWAGGVQGDHVDSAFSDKPIPVIAIDTQSANEAYEKVLRHAGASFKRDKVDARIVKEVESGATSFGVNGIINSQVDVGGWPELISSSPLEDNDEDGLPDRWEKKNKLDPKDVSDATEFTKSRQYTNLEVYLNSIVQ